VGFLYAVVALKGESSVQNKLFTANGLLRLSQIIGNPDGGTPPLIPVKKSCWWAGVKSGRFPKPVKIGNGRATFWKVEDILALIANA
jgi:prophage regulatory protein